MQLDLSLKRALEARIAAATGERFTIATVADVAGGCINSACVVGDGVRRFFVKRNAASALDMFLAEADGLRELAAAQAIRVPLPIAADVAEQAAFLVLEFLSLTRAPDPRRLGGELAALHRRAGAHYGWHRDNTIGATPQENSPAGEWWQFWRDRRLRPQFERAYRNGHDHLRNEAERLLAARPDALAGHEPVASLLHGDLWGGNAAGLGDGTPVLFDPAVYYGDREADLAMTELFGGFARDFYAAYREAWPLAPGYEERKPLYNLYHLLNHLNLFGASYLGQVRACLKRIR